MLPTFVTCCRQHVSMIQEHTTVIVYLASMDLLAARLALVTTMKCHIVDTWQLLDLRNQCVIESIILCFHL